MLVLDREASIAAWRRAEARIYPAVMVNAMLYQQYIGVVRAIAEELGDIHTEDDLVLAYEQRREIANEVIRRLTPSMAAVMDVSAVRDAAFCHRHREITREHGKELARERLEEARRAGADWVVLFEDVTPLGSQRLEMHLRTGRAIRSAAQVPLDGTAPTYELEVVQLDPRDGAWLLDQPPLMPLQRFDRLPEWEARAKQARELFGKE